MQDVLRAQLKQAWFPVPGTLRAKLEMGRVVLGSPNPTRGGLGPRNPTHGGRLGPTPGGAAAWQPHAPVFGLGDVRFGTYNLGSSLVAGCLLAS